MEYSIKAIPTLYRGVQFRSRLEARWAAFFDLCKFKWTYEPYDLDGWMPDFELRWDAADETVIRVLVEVKPFLWFRKDPFDFIDNELRAKVGRHSGVVVGAEFDPMHLGDTSRRAIGIRLFPESRWCEWAPFPSSSDPDTAWRQAASNSKRAFA
jgi:hypothetical protein